MRVLIILMGTLATIVMCAAGVPLAAVVTGLIFPVGLLWALLASVWTGAVRTYESPEPDLATAAVPGSPPFNARQFFMATAADQDRDVERDVNSDGNGDSGVDSDGNGDSGVDDGDGNGDSGLDGEPEGARASDRPQSVPEPAGEDDAPAVRTAGILLGWKTHPDRRVAIRSYYFGPIADDLVDACRSVWSIAKAVAEQARDAFSSIGDIENPIFMVTAAVCLFIGVPLGYVLGAAGTVVVALAYLAVAAVSFVAVLVISMLLRLMDMAGWAVFGIARTCSGCGRKVLRCPHYLCPGCGQLHKEIWPGPYGVVRRICKCGQPMRTMLFTGAAKLQGICPNENCETRLPRMFGRTAEIVIPLFGASNVGKTRLMYMLAQALKSWVADQHGEVRHVADADVRLQIISDSLAENGQPEHTIHVATPGLGLEIKFRLSKRFVLFFDTAGEMYTSHLTVSELKYLDKAKACIFVADPLSATSVWSQLNGYDQDRLQGFRTPLGATAKAYEATVSQMLRSARGTKRTDLAFVVTKVDLLEAAGVDLDHPASPEKWVSAEAGLDLGDTARSAQQSFRKVRYFATSAVDYDGRVDDSVGELLRWILARNGIKMGA